jgi:hypothetical protein
VRRRITGRGKQESVKEGGLVIGLSFDGGESIKPTLKGPPLSIAF